MWFIDCWRTGHCNSACNGDGKECEQPLVNTSCELVSDGGGPTVKGAVQKKEKNKYTISYQLTHRGRHQLHIIIGGKSIRGSTFAVVARLPIQKPGTPIRTIGNLNTPGVWQSIREERS